MKAARTSPTKSRRSPSSSPRKAKKLSKPTPLTPVQVQQQGPTAIQKATTHVLPTSSVFTIWYAAQYGKYERIQSILDRRAVPSIDVQEYRTKWSPLHFASRFGQIEIVQLLIDRGANPGIQDMSGNTALHLSAGWGNLRCTVLLLEAGADPSHRNQRNQTPLDVAVALGRQDQLRVLSSWQPLGLTPDELHARRASRLSLSDEDLLHARVAALQDLERELQSETNALVHEELHALFAKTRQHGESDPSLLPTFDRLCAAYASLNRHDEALAVAERASTLAEALYGHDDLTTLTWLNNTGQLLLALTRMEESEQHLEEAYRGFTARCGDHDMATLAVLENLAAVTIQRRRPVDAERHLRALLERLLTTLYDGGWNDRVFTLSMQLGVVVLEQKRVLEAQTIFHECLLHASSSLTAPDDALGCVEQLGRCAFLLGDLERAERLFTQAMRDALARPRDVRDHRRLHNNLAMVVIARKSTLAVQGKLQAEGYRADTGISTETITPRPIDG